ncbi:hypothetical protein DIPPA_15012 [Diplonema papillatum]|nr:hypothetical protein DIPPA_15012 [Diplonema papillatum]
MPTPEEPTSPPRSDEGALAPVAVTPPGSHASGSREYPPQQQQRAYWAAAAGPGEALATAVRPSSSSSASSPGRRPASTHTGVQPTSGPHENPPSYPDRPQAGVIEMQQQMILEQQQQILELEAQMRSQSLGRGGNPSPAFQGATPHDPHHPSQHHPSSAEFYHGAFHTGEEGDTRDVPLLTQEEHNVTTTTTTTTTTTSMSPTRRIEPQYTAGGVTPPREYSLPPLVDFDPPETVVHHTEDAAVDGQPVTTTVTTTTTSPRRAYAPDHQHLPPAVVTETVTRTTTEQHYAADGTPARAARALFGGPAAGSRMSPAPPGQGLRAAGDTPLPGRRRASAPAPQAPAGAAPPPHHLQQQQQQLRSAEEIDEFVRREVYRRLPTAESHLGVTVVTSGTWGNSGVAFRGQDVHTQPQRQQEEGEAGFATAEAVDSYVQNESRRRLSAQVSSGRPELGHDTHMTSEAMEQAVRSELMQRIGAPQHPRQQQQQQQQRRLSSQASDAPFYPAPHVSQISQPPPPARAGPGAPPSQDATQPPHSPASRAESSSHRYPAAAAARDEAQGGEYYYPAADRRQPSASIASARDPGFDYRASVDAEAIERLVREEIRQSVPNADAPADLAALEHAVRRELELASSGGADAGGIEARVSEAVQKEARRLGLSPAHPPSDHRHHAQAHGAPRGGFPSHSGPPNSPMSTRQLHPDDLPALSASLPRSPRRSAHAGSPADAPRHHPQRHDTFHSGHGYSSATSGSFRGLAPQVRSLEMTLDGMEREIGLLRGANARLLSELAEKEARVEVLDNARRGAEAEMRNVIEARQRDERALADASDARIRDLTENVIPQLEAVVEEQNAAMRRQKATVDELTEEIKIASDSFDEHARTRKSYESCSAALHDTQAALATRQESEKQLIADFESAKLDFEAARTAIEQKLADQKAESDAALADAQRRAAKENEALAEELQRARGQAEELKLGLGEKAKAASELTDANARLSRLLAEQQGETERVKGRHRDVQDEADALSKRLREATTELGAAEQRLQGLEADHRRALETHASSSSEADVLRRDRREAEARWAERAAELEVRADIRQKEVERLSAEVVALQSAPAPHAQGPRPRAIAEAWDRAERAVLEKNGLMRELEALRARYNEPPRSPPSPLQPPVDGGWDAAEPAALRGEVARLNAALKQHLDQTALADQQRCAAFGGLPEQVLEALRGHGIEPEDFDNSYRGKAAWERLEEAEKKAAGLETALMLKEAEARDLKEQVTIHRSLQSAGPLAVPKSEELSAAGLALSADAVALHVSRLQLEMAEAKRERDTAVSLLSDPSQRQSAPPPSPQPAGARGSISMAEWESERARDLADENTQLRKLLDERESRPVFVAKDQTPGEGQDWNPDILLAELNRLERLVDSNNNNNNNNNAPNKDGDDGRASRLSQEESSPPAYHPTKDQHASLYETDRPAQQTMLSPPLAPAPRPADPLKPLQQENASLRERLVLTEQVHAGEKEALQAQLRAARQELREQQQQPPPPPAEASKQVPPSASAAETLHAAIARLTAENAALHQQQAAGNPPAACLAEIARLEAENARLKSREQREDEGGLPPPPAGDDKVDHLIAKLALQATELLSRVPALKEQQRASDADESALRQILADLEVIESDWSARKSPSVPASLRSVEFALNSLRLKFGLPAPPAGGGDEVDHLIAKLSLQTAELLGRFPALKEQQRATDADESALRQVLADLDVIEADWSARKSPSVPASLRSVELALDSLRLKFGLPPPPPTRTDRSVTADLARRIRFLQASASPPPASSSSAPPTPHLSQTQHVDIHVSEPPPGAVAVVQSPPPGGDGDEMRVLRLRVTQLEEECAALRRQAGPARPGGAGAAGHRALRPGARVVRNNEFWSWADQDGGAGCRGTVKAIDSNVGWVCVQWDATGIKDNYRWNNDEGAWDLSLVEFGSEHRVLELEAALGTAKEMKSVAVSAGLDERSRDAMQKGDLVLGMERMRKDLEMQVFNANARAREGEDRAKSAEHRLAVLSMRAEQASLHLPDLEYQLAAAQAVAHRANAREATLEQLLDARCAELRASAEHAAALENRLRVAAVREDALSRRLDASQAEAKRVQAGAHPNLFPSPSMPPSRATASPSIRFTHRFATAASPSAPGSLPTARRPVSIDNRGLEHTHAITSSPRLSPPRSKSPVARRIF